MMRAMPSDLAVMTHLKNREKNFSTFFEKSDTRGDATGLNVLNSVHENQRQKHSHGLYGRRQHRDAGSNRVA